MVAQLEEVVAQGSCGSLRMEKTDLSAEHSGEVGFLPCRSILRRYPQVVEHERIRIRGLFQRFRRAARSVSRPGLDSDQDRIRPAVLLL